MRIFLGMFLFGITVNVFSQSETIEPKVLQGIRLDQVATEASFIIRMSTPGISGFISTTDFRNPVTISGVVMPDEAAVGQSVDIFVVDRFNLKLTMLDMNGNFNAWNGNISALTPFQENVILEDMLEIEFFNGGLDEGDHRFFIGYKPTGAPKGELHLTPVPARFTLSDNGDPFEPDEDLFGSEIGLLSLVDMGGAVEVNALNPSFEGYWFSSRPIGGSSLLFSLLTNGENGVVSVVETEVFENIINSSVVHHTGWNLGTLPDTEGYKEEFFTGSWLVWSREENNSFDYIYASYDISGTSNDNFSVTLDRAFTGFRDPDNPDSNNEPFTLSANFIGRFKTDFFNGLISGPYIGTDDETAYYVLEFDSGTILEKVGEIRQGGENGAQFALGGTITGIANGESIPKWKQISDESAVLVTGDGVVHFIDMSNPRDPDVSGQIELDDTSQINDIEFFNTTMIDGFMREGVVIATDQATHHISTSLTDSVGTRIEGLGYADLIDQSGQYIDINVYSGESSSGAANLELFISDFDTFAEMYRYQFDFDSAENSFQWRKTHENKQLEYTGDRVIFFDKVYFQNDETENSYFGKEIILE